MAIWLDNVVPGSKDLFISNSDSEISLNWVDHKATKKKSIFFVWDGVQTLSEMSIFFLSNQAGKLQMEKYPALSSGKNFKSRNVLFWRGTARGLVSFEHLLTRGTGQGKSG